MYFFSEYAPLSDVQDTQLTVSVRNTYSMQVCLWTTQNTKVKDLASIPSYHVPEGLGVFPVP